MIPFLMKETERLERMYLSDFLVEIYEGGEE